MTLACISRVSTAFATPWACSQDAKQAAVRKRRQQEQRWTLAPAQARPSRPLCALLRSQASRTPRSPGRAVPARAFSSADWPARAGGAGWRPGAALSALACARTGTASAQRIPGRAMATKVEERRSRRPYGTLARQARGEWVLRSALELAEQSAP